MELNDAHSFYNLGCRYSNGRLGLPQDYVKAFELWHRAGELGCAVSYSCIGSAYRQGRGVVEVDMKKAKHYLELAAMRGETEARHDLGVTEGNSGNYHRALKHWMIATEGGSTTSLEYIKKLYSNGYATKDDYANALRSYQAYLNEVKSDQRNEAAAFRDEFKYYESGL